MFGSSIEQNYKHLLNTVVDCCDDLITLKDTNFNYISSNKSFWQTFGFDNETEIINKSIKDILPPDTLFIIWRYLKRVKESGEAQTYTYKICNGEKIVRETSTPIFENGEITKILSIAKDVTHEETLKLRLMEKICQLNTVFESLPMQVFMKDKNFKYITSSKTSEENLCKLDNDNDDKTVFETKQMLTKEQSVIDKDGYEHWYKISKIPVKDLEENISAVISIIQDIDAEKQLEAQKELFLATLTHDLKNPVQAQLMSLKMLYEGGFGEINSEQKSIIDMVIESANYMNEMLYSILGTYKFDNGVITLEKSLFDVKELINICINEAKGLALNKNIKITQNFDIKNKKLFADEKQLRRVISNLLNNVVTYAFKDTEIKIRVKIQNNNMVFEFENSSPIIPDDIQSQIFDKYVSGAQNYKTLGIGLGLYFSRKVIEAHEGKIYLQADGTQNIFIFEIPIEASKEASIKW